jgi:hypothetical protein
MKNTALKATVAAIIGLSMAGAANAALITGAIGLAGNYVPINAAGPSGSDLTLATGFDVGNAIVAAASGDFAAKGAVFGHSVIHNDFYFSPPSTPVSPLWLTDTVLSPTPILGGEFGFNLLSLVVDIQNASQVNLSGSGVLYHPDFDDTVGSWTFTANSLGTGSFTWSSSNAAVPEPSILALLGLGILGFAGGRRFTKA